ncbi:alkane 1-monooxygenase [Fulvivirga kasyanovii]|uniref:Alkane 1-monooxygenase n=1 Tax=Fulvivirga kasyanovii TaxID=396812 RepID=A0ABW9RRP8_9BACT|nr:alkane 1-monooxygenase [Fulvivirga kasyanovii]MTI26716.1 alkane 1-monooxygenase [Fulvivirga kasyanovii]
MNIGRKLGFFTAFILPAWVLLGYTWGGWGNFVTLLHVFILLPLIDQSVGVDTQNVPEEKAKVISNEFYYRFVTYVWTWFQLAFIGWGIYAVTFGKISTPIEWIGFTLSFALVTGGIGITVAHELGHKKSSIERFYSKILLMTVSYMHFYIEHNKGHHVHVATPEDPATARKNETFYAFWVRSVFGGYVHAWKIENERLRRKNKSPLSLQNNMIWFAVLPVLFCAAITFGLSIYADYFTWQVPAFFFGQSFLAFSLLELVNYVEHYGIQRKEIAQGRYERVTPIHSWNASHLISNFFLFQLQRHSDHHANAIKRYQVLNHYDESPQLPAGYPTMIIIALVPPLWFSMMNKRLEKWHSANDLQTA